MSQVGVTEQPPGSNRVVYNDWYAARSGGQFRAAPWCATFVAWVFWQAWRVDLRDKVAPGAAYTPALLAGAQARRLIVPVADCRPADIVLFNFPGGEHVDHVGIACAAADRTHRTVTCVEGNTSEAGSQSNGGKVLVKRRPWTQVAAVVRVPPPSGLASRPAPPDRPPATIEEDHMFLCRGDNDPKGRIWLTNMLTRREVQPGDDLDTVRFLLAAAGRKTDVATLRQHVVDAIPRTPSDGDWLKFAAGIIQGVVDRAGIPGAAVTVDAGRVAAKVADELHRRLAQ